MRDSGINIENPYEKKNVKKFGRILVNIPENRLKFWNPGELSRKTILTNANYTLSR